MSSRKRSKVVCLAAVAALAFSALASPVAAAAHYVGEFGKSAGYTGLMSVIGVIAVTVLVSAVTSRFGNPRRERTTAGPTVPGISGCA
jgi:uncharacterized membrane protein